MKMLLTSTGKTIKIGNELGKGGEGSVYDIPANPSLVAKLYNERHLPDALKQAKLRFMAKTADADLLKYAAWPQETLHHVASGPIVGFLMPKVIERSELHEIYSPAQRRQNYPNVAWDFLIYVARNMAAAFAALHSHGHLIGDVNQKNFMFGMDSQVILVDCDSYQINDNGKLHLCKVGTAHFTPPELQGISSFDRIPRTINHDNFGLALLIFHLLLGGRHPYSGVPLHDNAGEALEKDIKAFRYAYSKDGRQRGLTPPPKSISISILPDPIEAMFTLAFTENGAKWSRPTAQQWVTALDGLRGQLVCCPKNTMHLYPNRITQCPWCALETSGVIYFRNLQAKVIPKGIVGFVLAKAWADIEAVTPPPTIPIPNISMIPVTYVPLPPVTNPKISSSFLRFLILVVTFGILKLLSTARPNSSAINVYIVLGLAWGAWRYLDVLCKPDDSERSLELAKRQARLNEARDVYDKIVARIRQEIGPETFHKKKQELALLRDKYLNLPEREKKEIANLLNTAEARQKQQFLERHFIETASISGVGPAKKAALRSFGIETAADVTWKRVIAVKGFGKVLTQTVVDWRKACESRFAFKPDLAITVSDKNLVQAKIATYKHELEIKLNSGAIDLQRLRQEMLSKSQTLSSELRVASNELAQAQANLNVV